MSPEDRLVHYRCALVSKPNRLLFEVENAAHAMLTAERPIERVTAAPDSIKVECFHGPQGTTMVVVSARDISARGWAYFDPVYTSVPWLCYVDGESHVAQSEDAASAILALSKVLRARIAKLTGLP